MVAATFLEMKPEAVLRHASLQSTKKVAMAVLAVVAVFANVLRGVQTHFRVQRQQDIKQYCIITIQM